MKAYLFDSLNRFSRLSEKLDAQAALCNKSWWLFNDEGDKSIYMFMDNGDFFVTTNGVGVKGRWTFIPASSSIIFDFQNQITMYHPAFFEDDILVLNLDGTSSYSFFIDEKKRGVFHPQTLAELKNYFDSKIVDVPKSVPASEHVNQEKERFLEVADEYSAVLNECRDDFNGFEVCVVFGVLILLSVLLFILQSEVLLAIGFFIIIVFSSVYVIVGSSRHEGRTRANVQNWVDQNPDKPVSEFLKRYYLSGKYPPGY